ncbi:MAG TPA: DegQ family serine endoprotease [Thermohalobaculum sp.]|nr:DegQ family serine endoprotease [Thermohalobaculum sp.]
MKYPLTRPSISGHRIMSPLVRAMAAVIFAIALLGIPTGPAVAQPVASFADLAEKLSPAVVNISTAQTVQQAPQREGPPLPEGSPFEDLFRDFFENGQPRAPQTVQSLGSGFVVSAEGYIVTNNHVIEEADEITVNFPDGLSLTATLIGTDPKTDIALLKVEPTAPLPFVNFGDSDAIRVGDWVLAIGNPFGLGGSVSAGIVSARNRDINAGPYDDFIQTDAAINKGNSGGPLFNMAGEVIGVNSAIISPTGGSIGIGFSVPANLTKGVIDQLRQFGVTRRGWLGVRIQSVNDEMAEALGMEKAMGALVADVTEGGPAASGGVEPGDVIIKFDGKDVVLMRDLPRMVAETAVDKAVRVVLFRKGKTETLLITIALLEEENAPVTAKASEPDSPVSDALELPELGLTLGTLSADFRAQFGIPDDVSGVVVIDVASGGSAGEKGISAGDIIVEVGQEPVGSPAEVDARVADAITAGRKSVLLLIQSGGDLRFVPLAVGG